MTWTIGLILGYLTVFSFLISALGEYISRRPVYMLTLLALWPLWLVYLLLLLIRDVIK